MNPEVSVVIPTHDRKALLAQTLRSVLWQSNVDFEVIVVDDGSTDDTAEAVLGLGDGRVRLVRNQVAQGVTAARNRGSAEARGEWVAFVDDDDLWAPDKLDRQLRTARAANRVWVYAGVVHVNTSLRVLSEQPLASPKILMARLPSWNPIPGGCSNVIMLRSALLRAGGFDQQMVNLADWDLWIRLGRSGPPAWVNSPLIAYRVHAGNASRNTALILAEADRIEHRYGAPVDRGALHRYLAWVCVRSGGSREVFRHLRRAAMQRDALSLPVARDLALLVRAAVVQRLPWLCGRKPHRKPAAWTGQAEAWLACLR